MPSSTHGPKSGCIKKHGETERISHCKHGTSIPHKSVAYRLLYDTLRSAMKKSTLNIEKVALYARVSTKGGRQDTENQLIALREYCAKQGWEVVAEYVD